MRAAARRGAALLLPGGDHARPQDRQPRVRHPADAARPQKRVVDDIAAAAEAAARACRPSVVGLPVLAAEANASLSSPLAARPDAARRRSPASSSCCSLVRRSRAPRRRPADPDRARHRLVRGVVFLLGLLPGSSGRPQPDVGHARRARDRDLDRVQRAALGALPRRSARRARARARDRADLRLDRRGGARLRRDGDRRLRRADRLRHPDAARLRHRHGRGPDRLAARRAAGAAGRADLGRAARAAGRAWRAPPPAPRAGRGARERGPLRGPRRRASAAPRSASSSPSATAPTPSRRAAGGAAPRQQVRLGGRDRGADGLGILAVLPDAARTRARASAGRRRRHRHERRSRRRTRSATLEGDANICASAVPLQRPRRQGARLHDALRRGGQRLRPATQAARADVHLRPRPPTATPRSTAPSASWAACPA